MNKQSLHPEQKKYKVPKGPKPIAHKNKNHIGLGRTIANQRRMENEVQLMPDGDIRFTTDKHEANWVKLRSVTQENPLDEFLNTAELADTDFSADKGNQMKIIKVGNTSIVNQSGLLTPAEMDQIRIKHQLFENKLTIPRRPKWTRDQLKLQVERQENLAFLEWRRELANLTENNELILTPFERNLEVWRQLWRVVERSNLIVQIVDARNPLFFRSLDLVNYVQELDDPENNNPKNNLLLVNKADLLTVNQRIEWAKYFVRQGIEFVFFSASRANEVLEQENEQLDTLKDLYEEDHHTLAKTKQDLGLDAQLIEKVKILKINELEDLFIQRAPELKYDPEFPDRKLQIGLVGYPNVGKSSTINALVGSKKVSVSATPGKTKHFQTIHLSPKILLCDCPGLVFPNFAYTNGELVCNGVLPVDQLREHIPPVSIVCQRIPKFYLEAVYGIHISIKSVADGGNGQFPTAAEFLNAYARSRGYMTQGFGSADESRASRYILKDYVNGKLLFVNPPPKFLPSGELTVPSVEEQTHFNAGLYTLASLPESRKSQIEHAIKEKNMPMDEFKLSEDLSKLSFSQHLANDKAEEDKGAQLKTKSGDSTSTYYGGRQAQLESAGDDLDREFFSMNDIKGKFQKPFHQQESSGAKKHNKKNKKSAKKTRVVNY